MIIRVLILFVFFVVSDAQSEGDRCWKDNNTYGVCRSLNSCETTFDEVKQKIKQYICLFDDTDPLVCCSGASNPVPPIIKIRPLRPGKCILPPYPDRGIYVVANAPLVQPGQGLHSVQLNVTCRAGYEVVGDSVIFCQDGTWSNSIPKCVRFCKLDSNPSVRYNCLVTDPYGGRRDCNTYEPSGTTVSPECNSPNYYSAVSLPYMRCIDGIWDYVAVCTPECGRITPQGAELIIDGRPAARGQLPWHAGIYTKITMPYVQICGATLVRNSVVISGAHCFWNDATRQQPASMYAVAVGKMYRPWNDDRDFDAQKSDVKEIKIPVRFQGSAANYQDDIAIVILETAFEYKTHIRPVCLDFDINFDRRQLQLGNFGKAASWGLNSENGPPSQILKVVEVSYLSIEQCIAQSPPGFREYITSDKICAGYGNGTALCRGDSGGGLAFPESDRGTERYYLRGIISTAPTYENSCNTNTFAVFTQIIKHEHFIKDNLPGKCILPPYPDHGIYVVANAPLVQPGQGLHSVQLNVTCRAGYGVVGDSVVFCQDGTWSNSIAKCVRFCKLDSNPSVRYNCLVTDPYGGRRDCNTYEPSGTIVSPECNSPNYYSAVSLPYMRCIDGIWDYVAVCTPECGRITPQGAELIIDGRPAAQGQLPWYAGIYTKTTMPYLQICGATLVSTSVVISGAHCFWNNDATRKQPASMYAVAVGKIYRPWNNDRDVDAQKSDVKEIKIPVRFQGRAANFQDDIAIVILETAFEYKTHIRPVCLDFDINFDRRQLQLGNFGKAASWGLTSENGPPSQVLKVVEVSYLSIEQCIAQSPLDFREYITSDKICAGYGNGTELCRGDSGGGLAFPKSDRGTERYYLRGIVSTAPTNGNLCNTNTFAVFTQIIKHEHFIKDNL